MSHLLYSKRVFWNGRKGGVSIAGTYRNITAPPVFRGIDEIDYAPETGCMQLRPSGSRMREMRSAEIAVTEAYLNAIQYGGPIMAMKELTPDDA